MKELNEQQMGQVAGGYAYGSYLALNGAINLAVLGGQDRAWVKSSIQAALDFYRTPVSQRKDPSFDFSIAYGQTYLKMAHWRVG